MNAMGAVTLMQLDEAALTSQAAAPSTGTMAGVGPLALLLHVAVQRRTRTRTRTQSSPQNINTF